MHARRGPGGILVALAALVALVAAGSAQVSYEVQRGETLGGIANRHGTSVSALMAANDLASPHHVEAGSTLRIPASAGTGGGGHHVVGSGENLSSIARRYGVTTSQLVAWNGLRDADTVWAGARIAVAGPAAVDVASVRGGSHRVTRGENLTAIARRYGVSVLNLAAANDIADPNRVQAGARLTIPGGGGGGGWRCPVDGAVRFVNDFGIAKPGGRYHDGVDLYAARGTPVVAPVAGRVEQVRGRIAGLQVRLTGTDGNTYIGTHLDRFGASGDVRAGEVIGTVGSTGNARGTSPHLHFEIHLGGSTITNPYPSLRRACG